MIQITPKTPLYVHTGVVDFRKGIDGLCGVCKYQLKKDPLSGAMFAFINRSKIALKILVYDGQGFWVYHKRLSCGKFKWWPGGDDICSPIIARELYVLIWNGDPKKINMQEDWRSIDK